MLNWLALSPYQRKTIITSITARSGFPEKAVEKDWWVTMVLKALFQTPYANNLLFKGGTSLSKAWKLIERFSEDIDIAIDKETVGYVGTPTTKSQIKRLKEKSGLFIKTTLKEALEKELLKVGIPADACTVLAEETASSDTDPQKLVISYPPLFEPNPYLADQVIIEVSARSLKEPYTAVMIQSIIDDYSQGQPYAYPAFAVPSVNPERTFLEKAFLLHEEFQKPVEKMKHERKSRHFHDLDKIMDTSFGQKALKNGMLYQKIVAHREVYNNLPGIDYTTHHPTTINFIPPDKSWNQWENDYESMRQNMILGDSLDYTQLMDRMKELLNRFRQVTFIPKEGGTAETS
jgi:Nucleotidyl transferase AbiEii toxin, Type IV TA system